MDVKEISRMLAERAETVTRRLLPGARLIGREMCAGSTRGEEGKSLKVCISGEKMGLWSDFAAGESGDMIDLWAATRGISLTDAIREVKDYLGISDPVLERPTKRTYRKPKPPANCTVPEVGSKVTRYLTETRGLSLSALEAYKVGEAQSVGPWENWQRQQPAVGPWIVFPFLRDGEIVGIKYLHLNRKDGKKFTLVEPGCAPTLFGWHAIPADARKVVLCEGELDAVSLYQYGYNALSVPFGGGKGDKQQWVDYDWEHLERFEDIYLCMDNDDEGRAAVQELVMRLGAHRCHIVTLPRKDANQCLIDGVTTAEIAACFSAAKTVSPEELKTASSFYTSVLDEFYPAAGKLPGCDMPWPDVPFRFLRGEVSVITGVNGHGKSLMWGFIMLHAMRFNERVCIASLEMRPSKTLYRMVRQATGLRKPRHTEIADCLNWMDGKLWLFNLVGTGKIDRMLEVFTYAQRRHGVNHVVIDSMMKCGIAEDDYTRQKELVERLCDFANKTGLHVHLIVHPRKADDESPPGKMDVKGTGAITDLAFNVFSVYRNKHKEVQVNNYRENQCLPKGMTEEEMLAQPDAVLYIHKARNVEDCEGSYRLYYHGESMQYHRRSTEPPYILWGSDAGEAPPF